ncbi:hypothetical protein CR513_03757, partial [Mucuna pruriens]
MPTCSRQRLVQFGLGRDESDTVSAKDKLRRNRVGLTQFRTLESTEILTTTAERLSTAILRIYTTATSSVGKEGTDSPIHEAIVDAIAIPIATDGDSTRDIDSGSEAKMASILSIKVKVLEYPTFRQMVDRLKGSSRRAFETRFGSILDLLEVEAQPEALTALVQFYDPPLRTFLFQDFQMASTLDEY